jgi:prepilin-type N-terminal cleavage/methylation domain-containing protein
VFNKGFTLIELLIVVIVIALLVSMAVPAFYSAKLKTLHREAQAGLRMVQAAEKVRRTDTGTYTQCNSTADCNDILQLDLPETGTWAYSVGGVANTTFCAQAVWEGHARVWHAHVDSDVEAGDCAGANAPPVGER